MDLHFENSGLAGPYLAVFGVTVLALLAAVRKRRRLQQVSDPSLLSRTWLPTPSATSRTRNELLFWFAIGTFLTGALLQPQWGYVWRETKRRGVDIVIAVDVSESMMASDVQPNRLARARYKIRDLVEHLKGDRIGLVAFAGTAFIESPLTVDYGTFRLFLDSLTPELIPIQGTNIRAALEKSLEALGYQSMEEPPPPGASAKSQAILLITDGEDFEGDFSKLGEFAAAQGVQIYIIGIGTKEGGPIPVGKGFKRDKSGKMVLTHLDETKLVDLAKKTGGIYVEGRGGDDDIGTIYDRGIRTFLESRTIEGGRRRLWNERFQVPLLFAITLLFLGPWGGVLGAIRSRRSKGSTVEVIKTAAPVILLLLTNLLFCSPARADSESAGYEGKQDLIAGNFDKAQTDFSAAISGTSPDLADPRLYFGLGESNYRLGRFRESAEAFKRAAELSAKQSAVATRAASDLQGQAQYNQANALVQLGQYQLAIDTYLAAQKLRPDDREITDNLAYTRRLLSQQENQEKNKEKNQEKEDPKKDSQQKQQKPNQQNQQPEKEQQKKDQGSKDQQNSDQNNEQDHPDRQNHGKKEQNSQEHSNSDPNQQQSTDGSSEEQNNQKEENQQDRQQGQQSQEQQQQGQDQSDSQQQSNSEEHKQKDQQSGNEGDKPQPKGGGEKNQGAAPNSSDGNADSEANRQQGANGGETGDSGQSSSQGDSNSGPNKQSGNNAGKTGDDKSLDNQAGEGSKQAEGRDGQAKAATGSKPDPADQGKAGEEQGGAGYDRPDLGDEKKAGGEKKGQDSDAAGADIEPERGGEDSSLTAKDRSMTQSAGTKSETNGSTLDRNEYATPLGADEGNSGGEGAKDRLAVKEGKGDHTGLSGPESAGSQRDGSGKAAVESFLENVGEERGMYLKYREQKGLQQLRTEGRETPEKDW